MYPELLGRFIATEREKVSPSRRFFAEKVGLDPGTVENIENGYTKSPGLNAILAIAKGLDLHPMKLISVYEGKDPHTSTQTEIDSHKALNDIMEIYLKSVPSNEVTELFLKLTPPDLFMQSILRVDGADKFKSLITEAINRLDENNL